MRTVEFRRLLNDGNALRVRFELEQGLVTRFVVQLECRFNDEWTSVVRYDAVHGFAHCDMLRPYAATAKTEIAIQDYNEALTFAIGDLAKNWSEYRRRYEEWLREKK